MKKFLFAVSALSVMGFSHAASAQCCAPGDVKSPNLLMVSDHDAGVSTTVTTETKTEAGVPAADATVKTEVTAPADASVSVTVDAAAQGSTIADVASADANLSTLVSALKAADWVEPLKGAGPYTVFAPSNAAFEALPAGTLDDLLKPENKEKLQNVLKHHVVDGKISASDIAEGSTDVKAHNGTTLKVEKNAEGVTVGGAKVTQADVAASNGVIHVIDKVIVE